MSPALKLTRYLVSSDSLHATRTGFHGRVLFNTRSGAIVSIAQRAWELVAAGRIDELPSALYRQLIDARFVVPAAEDELQAVIHENLGAIEDNDVLYQVVQPSAWCQLDCGYCGQEHTRRRLSEDHQQEFLRRVAARLASGSYRQLKIGWFGAEPLAGIEVIRSLTPRARALAADHGCGYSARIVTNGLALTPKMVTELFDQHSVAEAEVTLDGLAPDHDRQRYTKGGRGSFERIFANVCAVARSTALRVVVRCNVTRANAEGVAPLIEVLAAAGLAGRVGFYTSPVYAWGNDAHESALERNNYARAEVEWLALQVRLGFQVGLVPQRRRIVCLAVQKNAEVLDAFGATYNCTEAPYVPAYGKPNVFETRIPVAALKRAALETPVAPASRAERLASFNDQILAGAQPPCAACVMLPVCGGQCPKAWQEGHEPCPSAKHNMRERLNLIFALSQPAEQSDAVLA